MRLGVAQAAASAGRAVSHPGGRSRAPAPSLRGDTTPTDGQGDPALVRAPGRGGQLRGRVGGGSWLLKGQPLQGGETWKLSPEKSSKLSEVSAGTGLGAGCVCVGESLPAPRPQVRAKSVLPGRGEAAGHPWASLSHSFPVQTAGFGLRASCAVGTGIDYLEGSGTGSPGETSDMKHAPGQRLEGGGSLPGVGRGQPAAWPEGNRTG